MAWTETKRFETVFGNLRAKSYLLVADSATLELDTGLGEVLSVDWCPKSCATNPNISINVNSTGVSADGYVSITGVTSGNELFVTIYGR